MKLLKQTKRNPDKGSAKIINPVGFTGTDLSFLFQLSELEKAKTAKHVLIKKCFKMFYAVWPLCKTSTCFNLKHVLACFTVKHLPFGQAFIGLGPPRT